MLAAAALVLASWAWWSGDAREYHGLRPSEEPFPPRPVPGEYGWRLDAAAPRYSARDGRNDMTVQVAGTDTAPDVYVVVEHY